MFSKSILTVAIILIFSKQVNIAQSTNNVISNRHHTEIRSIKILDQDTNLLGTIKSNKTTILHVDKSNESKVKRSIDIINKWFATENEYQQIFNNSKDIGMSYEELNLRTFLTLIKFAEGHGKIHSYNVIYGGTHVTSLDKHPNIRVTKWGYTSTAAGAYGILNRIWKSYAKKLNLKDFSGMSQDLVVIEILRKHNLLNSVMKHGLTEILSNDKMLKTLNQIWTPFPKGSQQGTTIKQIESAFRKFFYQEMIGETSLAIPRNSIDLFK